MLEASPVLLVIAAVSLFIFSIFAVSAPYLLPTVSLAELIHTGSKRSYCHHCQNDLAYVFHDAVFACKNKPQS